MTKVSYNTKQLWSAKSATECYPKVWIIDCSHGLVLLVFKSCCFIDSHKTSFLFLEMEWHISCFNHVCFKEIHSNYPPIWFSMCVEKGIREWLHGFSKSAFPIHVPRNKHAMWKKNMYVKLLSEAQQVFLGHQNSWREKHTAEANPNKSKKQSDIRPNSGLCM